ncbi:MAG: sugar ABC transporter permease [Acidimicrobiia bacterium]|nr:sugar ABC transporter permease [Acidimicrobiia bacterium]
MTDVATAPDHFDPPGDKPADRSFASSIRSMEIDTRLLGMLVALLVIWITFHVWSGGTFLTPRNLWNLTVQTSAVAIMATGMVLIIVSRNIDLSVGAMLAVVGMWMALLQAEILPDILGFDSPWTWVITLVAGITFGALIGAFQGAIVAYVGVPSFIVTLGGLLIWRGAAWAMASGRTISPMDNIFGRFGGGGGLEGTIGGGWSWIVGISASIGIVFLLINSRRRRVRYGFKLRPRWADYTIGVIGVGVILGAIFYLNRYYLPELLARQEAEAQGIAWPADGLNISLGLANPVLLAIVVALVMTFVATRLSFGRYIFAIGGNPEAAELAGINTKVTTVKTFALMGILVAIAAAVQIARLDAAVSGLGQLTELYVIAAAVIGGTSLSGGIGTIPGAVLGALVMQSLQSGMVLVGVDAPLQDIAVGGVLVLAVALDTFYRRRSTA